MATYTYQVQRSVDGLVWSDVSGAAGSFVGVHPFTQNIPYVIQSADTNDFLRLKVTRADGAVKYSGIIGPVAVTGGGGGSGTGSTDFVSATDWSRPDPPTPSAANVAGWHMVPFNNQTGFQNAINAMAAHDYIYYSGTTGPLVIGSSSSTIDQVFAIRNKNLSGPAVIDFGVKKSIWASSTEANNYVHFAYTGTNKVVTSFFLQNCTNVHLYGGEFTNDAGSGILWYGNTNNNLWYDYLIHDVAGSGLLIFSVGGPVTYLDTRGEVYNFALKPSIDPHADKGTGIHACMIQPPDPNGYATDYNRTVVYGHDSLPQSSQNPEGAGGSVMQIGSDGTVSMSHNQYAAFGENMWMRGGDGHNPGSVGSQTSGNLFNLWGRSPLSNSEVLYAEAHNITGAMFCCGGGNWKNGNLLIHHGRAHDTNKYTSGGNGPPNNVPYPSGFNNIYNDCTVI